jgi:ATP-dependent Lon protease
MERSDILIEDDAIEVMPVLALRGISIYPKMTMSFDVERKFSIHAINAAVKDNRHILLLAQRDVLKEYPDFDELYDIGVICVIKQFLKSPDGSMRIMVEGLNRAKVIAFDGKDTYLKASVSKLPYHFVMDDSVETVALIRSAISLYQEYSTITGNAVPETFISLKLNSDAEFLSFYLAQNLNMKYEEKQEILEIEDPIERIRELCNKLTKEIQVLKTEREINVELHQRMNSNQRANILREQLRIIQGELGEDELSEAEEYRDKIHDLKLDESIRDKLLKEVDKLVKQPYASSESAVIRSYLDAVLALPWNKYTKERLDLDAARKILDKEHFGLEKVKERIIEFMAVKKMAPDVKGAILCLVGPPGVGKTSIAISIAHATNRKLARMSLGGIHDEAEIRGHRKTYVGAMPGRIMNAITQAGTSNPLILLDEIDKLGSDYRGDPSSALLEALDPEQNTSFRDHYLEIPYDLSEVLFITTANTTDTIPRPLLDRMEVIELSSYTDEEKLQIAKEYLLPKQRKKHGLDARKLKLSDDVIRDIISSYTRESGVRQLERELAAICRKTDAKIASGEMKSLTVKSETLESLLGPRRFKPEQLAGKDAVGVVNGLAWTSVGGEILEVEAVALDGSGKIELTGNLGDVMKESAHAAITCIRSRCKTLGIDEDFYKNKDIHLHFPEGAVPKDGPSAGITISIAVISALTGIPVKRDLAMTGEITLSGRVLPIGGLKEKTMAAMRYGMKTVIIPADNESDLEEIDQTVRRSLNFVIASKIDDVISAALVLPTVTDDKCQDQDKDASIDK